VKSKGGRSQKRGGEQGSTKPPRIAEISKLWGTGYAKIRATYAQGLGNPNPYLYSRRNIFGQPQRETRVGTGSKWAKNLEFGK